MACSGCDVGVGGLKDCYCGHIMVGYKLDREVGLRKDERIGATCGDLLELQVYELAAY